MRQLKKKSVSFYTFTPKDEKFYKIVMRAAAFTTEDEVQTVLEENLKNPFNCIKLKGKNNQSQSFLITTNSKTDYEELTKIKHLDHIQIK